MANVPPWPALMVSRGITKRSRSRSSCGMSTTDVEGSDIMPKNEKHSHRDYTNTDLRKTQPDEWTGQIVVGTQFGREKPRGHPKGAKVKVFPDGAHSVVFKHCCLDNAELPPGSSLLECTTRNLETQPDGLVWIVDRDGNPIAPLEEV